MSAARCSRRSGFDLEGFRDESVVPRRFSSDNRSVYLTGVREGETYNALYRLDLQTQQLEKVHAFAAAGVDEVITDFADLESGNLPDSRWGRAYLQRVLGTDVAKLRAQSPVYSAQNIRAPVLLIHGKADGRADFEQAQRMRAALEKSQKKVEWLALGREG
ncbi:MAG: alpha/beta hydrolase family protein, partial [Steroidobacteraceae bacterium]